MIKKIISLFFTCMILSACTLNSPSTISSSPVQLSETTMMEQIKVSDLSHAVIDSLAAHYTKNGASTLDLTMTFDPASKDFTAMNAVRHLKHVKKHLVQKGVRTVTTQTQEILNGTPSLLVSYDMVQALPPQGCKTMAGLYREGTSRDLGAYKFGCTVDTMLAKQVAYPSDLKGNANMGENSGRRQAIITEPHLRGDPKEPITGVERGDLVSE